jgi:hypothetical protein
MAGEIQLNSTTMATESSGTITLSNVNSANNRTNLGLGSMATQNANAVALTGGSLTGTEIDLKSSGTTIYKSDGTTAVLSESGGVVTLNNGTIGSGVVFPSNTIQYIDYVSVTSVDTVDTDTDNTAWQDTGLSVTVPSATVAKYSKIVLTVSNIIQIGAATFAFIKVRLQRTAPSSSTLAFQERFGIESSSVQVYTAPFTTSVVDASLGSGDHTYKVQYQEENSVYAGNIYPLGRAPSISTITAFGII